MTKKLSIFLAFYLLVAQPALWWRLRNDIRFYQLAAFNAGIFLIARIVSAIFSGWSSSTPMVKPDNMPLEQNKSAENQEEDVDSLASEEKEVEEPKEEEKNEEKKSEKVMKETVSIPKIVKPLTSHNTQKRRKKEVKWGQRVILILTLALSGLIARVLQEFFGIRSAVIAVLIGYILYLLIWKIFDVNWFYVAKKLFTNWLYIVLILAWIWYCVYTMQQEDKDFKLFPEGRTDTVISYVKNRFKWEEDVVNPYTWAVYVFEWTGEVISTYVEPVEENNQEENLEWDNMVESGDVADLTIDENQAPVISDEESKEQVTMWDAIKALLAWTTLSTSKNVQFTYVSTSNELYPYFKTAYDKKMIWKSTNPSNIVSCDTYITMKWILEWRSVGNYSEIKAAYRTKANELWKLNWCEKWAYLTKWNL